MEKSGQFQLYEHTDRKHRHYVFTPSFIYDRRNDFLLSDETSILLNKAYYNLGKLDSMCKHIPNFESIKKNLLLGEMLKSCRIDKNPALISEVLLGNSENYSITQVWNCYTAIENMASRITSREALINLYGIVTSGRKILVDHDYRKKIAYSIPNCVTNTRQYNPPLPSNISELMNNFLEFITSNDNLDVLIKSALIYYQFETIHPFDSANGRVGRLIPMLFMVQTGVLSNPLLLMSDFLLEFHKDCIDYFSRVQHLSDYDDWINFYISGIIISTSKTMLQIEKILVLRQKNKDLLQPFAKSIKQLLEIFRYIEAKPIFSTKEIADTMGINFSTAKKAIDLMLELNIIVQLNEQARYKLFTYQSFLGILE